MDVDKRCLLCTAPRGPHTVFRRRRDICDWCADGLERAGYAWCATGKHKVAAHEMAAGKPRCKACEAARSRRYDRRAYNRAWRAANPEKVLAHRHSEQQRASQRRYQRRRWQDATYRARARQWRKDRYAQHRDAELVSSRIRRQRQKVAAWRRMLGRKAA